MVNCLWIHRGSIVYGYWVYIVGVLLFIVGSLLTFTGFLYGMGWRIEHHYRLHYGYILASSSVVALAFS